MYCNIIFIVFVGRFASIASYFNDFIIHAIVYVGVIFKEN
ncbi:putative membrane protein [Escherichia coli 2845650]|nr:putative membrane protein [Escherichia coli 2845650]